MQNVYAFILINSYKSCSQHHASVPVMQSGVPLGFPPVSPLDSSSVHLIALRGYALYKCGLYINLAQQQLTGAQVVPKSPHSSSLSWSP